MNSQTILVVFVALTCLALVAQAAILLVFLLAAKKAVEKLREDFDELRANAVPFFSASRDALTRIAPKIEPLTSDIVKAASSLSVISSDVAQITTKVRGQVDSVQDSTADLVDRFKHQAARVDSMVTTTLDAADQVGNFLQSAVSVPARQLSGILAAIKAIIESLGHTAAAPPAVHRSNDHETFI
jgi:methyl-accepting chemotaxis protein